MNVKPMTVGCKYGAPLGRLYRLPADTDEPVKLKLVKLKMVGDGAYDQGGAYWGCGDPIYMAKGEASDVVVELYVRVKDREEAKLKIRDRLSNATFYR